MKGLRKMAKVKVRFIGNAPAAIFSNIPECPSVQFQRYGQVIELEQGIYENILAGVHGASLPLLTEEEFQGLGHPPDHLAKYGSFESHAMAPAEFINIREKGNSILLDKIRKKTDTPPLVLPPAPPNT